MASPEKAILEPERGAKIPCMFNPETLSFTRSNNWSGTASPGKREPRKSFGGAESGTFSLDLLFDTTDTGKAVTEFTDQLSKLMDPDPQLPGTNLKKNKVRPPYVIFHWGDLHSFKSIVKTMTVNFTYFSATGVPLRAKAGLSLEQYEPDMAFGKQNPTSGTPEPHHVHRVQPGETLDRIAAGHYGDAGRWRTIASANGIQDPLAVRPGTMLALPRLD